MALYIFFFLAFPSIVMLASRLMRLLRLPALKTALADLLENRHDLLVASNAGKTYESILGEKKSLIDALPEALTGGKPFADALSEADDDHDGFGGAIWFLTEAYLRSPDTSAVLRATVLRVRAAFIPELDVLRARYVDEIEAAKNNKSDLATHKADLESIPIANGKTLYDWCGAFVARGELIGTLLGQRADITALTRANANKLRMQTVATLGRFRGALADELTVNKDLPQDLEARIFAYFDELAAMAAHAKKPESPPST
jgi:hypothetical protein